jgi:hypothetical protein
VTADDRAGSASNLSLSAQHSLLSTGETQTASFVVGDVSLELTAAPGAARLVVIAASSRDVFVVDPAALDAWARAIDRLVTLTPATMASERVEFRSPFLIDREGRPSIAFEGLVGDDAVTYRMVVNGPESSGVSVVTAAETVRAIAEAASGAIVVARATPRGEV